MGALARYRRRDGVYIEMDRSCAPPTFIPGDEAGTVVAFAQRAEELGFSIVSIGRAFPDATLHIDGVTVKAEFEYLSRNFKSHGHDPNGCDMIICWRDNWGDCPLPVLELSTCSDL